MGDDRKERDAIVHRLRSQGWSREDAIEHANELMAERVKRREAPSLPHLQGNER